MISKYEPKIVIIEDQVSLCESLDWLFKTTLKLPTAIYHKADDFLQAYNPDMQGCILLDVLMPGMSGLELIVELKKRGNQIPIIVLTGHGDIPMAVRALQNGAKDFLTKPFNPQQLLDKINLYLVEQKELLHKKQCYLNLLSCLTTREREVMQFIVMGKLNKQIAAEMKISSKTVELHRANLMRKLQIKRVAELMKINFLLASE